MKGFLRLRHSDEAVGLLVVIAVAVFLGAILQAGVLRDWLRPQSTLIVLLPAEGVAGLSAGAEAEVLGTRAGTVRRVVIEPDRRIRAEVLLDDQARVFIRRDSVATIRRRFGIAGASFLDISRGSGAELDWDFAVIEAVSERAPTETVGALLDDVRARVIPIVEDLGRIVTALATTTERLATGEGTVGRLLTDDTIARQAEGIMGDARDVIARLEGTFSAIERASREVQEIATAAASPQSGIPALIRRAEATLATLQQASRDLARATPRLPAITRNVEQATDPIPALILQTQTTARELEMLLGQLRGLWLLGGSGPAAPAAAPRPPPERVRP
jgi:phospholipid/cholesterol/gamma-HCH transport system substrate-binding protein